MRKIHQLPEHIVAQIAAGEVIERPAYAVKELVENAIDANADNIQIILEDAGLKKIMLIDNGEGMSREDLHESYKHHTTSKLFDNLTGIKSLGFRGEALSSIASVSSMTIRSKSSTDSAGTEIQLTGGNAIKVSSIGMPQGTHIIVEQLFSSVPVRKKFLKSFRTELHQTVDIVLQTALAYPSIRFQLIHNNKVILDFAKIENPEERIKSLLGQDIFLQLIPIEFSSEYLTVKGFVSKPYVISSNMSKQYLFINNRNVKDKRISQAVKESYGRLLDNTSYPICVLFLSLPPEMVDVNVHPRKEHVAFINNEIIFDSITAHISEVLKKSNLSPFNFFWKKNDWESENMPSQATTILRDQVAPWSFQGLTNIIKSSEVSQLHNVYLLTQTYDGIVLIDQHAAHERILYERFVTEFRKQKNDPKVYELPDSIVIHLSPIALTELKERQIEFDKIGFHLEEFGESAIKITHVPLFFKDHVIPALMREMIDDITVNKEMKLIDKQSQTMLAYLACRSAIKAGDVITKIQRKEIIEQLEKTENNATCPHGRPTKVEIPLRDIHRFFKRT